MSWLSGQTAIVTGVSSGLGRALATRLARHGATVIGCARRADKGVTLTEALRAEGLQAHFVEADIAAPDGRARVVEVALKETGRVDVLINNAATSGPVARVEEVSEDQWRQILDTNLIGAVGLSQLVTPHMRRQRSGVILNIASINAVFGVTYLSAYNASKAALAHFARTLAAETARDNVRINTVILGGVQSEMSRDTASAMSAYASGAVPSSSRLDAYERLLTSAEDAAASIAILCHPDARLITGSDIAIDGALTAGAAASGFIYGGLAAMLQNN